MSAKASGFTLLEVLVVASITVIIAGLLIQNFSRTRLDLNQNAINVQDAIREAQSYALSGSVFQGKYRCGFGITFNSAGYKIFAGPDAEDPATVCSAADRTKDTTVRDAVIPNASVEIASGDSPSTLKTIYFEPPDPKTYIDGNGGPNIKTTILIRLKGAACPSADCRSILVTTAGQIQMQ